MRKIIDDFEQLPDGRRTHYVGILYADEWEALGLPPLSLQERTVWHFLRSCDCHRHRSIKEIKLRVWGARKGSRHTVRRCLLTLEELGLAGQDAEGWFALAPALVSSSAHTGGAVLPSSAEALGVGRTAHTGGAELPTREDFGGGAELPTGGGRTAHGQNCPGGAELPTEGVQNCPPTYKEKREEERESSSALSDAAAPAAPEGGDDDALSPEGEGKVKLTVEEWAESWDPEAAFEEAAFSLAEVPLEEPRRGAWLALASRAATWHQILVKLGSDAPMRSPRAYRVSVLAQFREREEVALEALAKVIEFARARRRRREATERSAEAEAANRAASTIERVGPQAAAWGLDLEEASWKELGPMAWLDRWYPELASALRAVERDEPQIFSAWERPAADTWRRAGQNRLAAAQAREAILFRARRTIDRAAPR